MIKNRFYFVTTFLILQTAFVSGQDKKIEIPDFNDKYSGYVKELENGNTAIDYADFRNSFLESGQYGKKGIEFSNYQKQLYGEVKKQNFNEVIRLAKAMLSIDYTSMFAHKFLQQSYKILGDTMNTRKYHDIEFGLLNSIIKSGDGKTCETGWHVTQIEEEYFVLNMIGGSFQSQSIISSAKNNCDKMEIKTEDGDIETYFFEANKVFELEKKMFGN